MKYLIRHIPLLLSSTLALVLWWAMIDFGADRAAERTQRILDGTDSTR